MSFRHALIESLHSRNDHAFANYLEEQLAFIQNKNLEADILREVCKRGKPHHLSLLIERGWDVNMRLGIGEPGMDDGWTGDDATALHYAAQVGKDSHMKLLLEAGADVNARDADAATPILTPWLYGDVDTLQILIEHGADVNAENNEGETALLQWAQESSVEGVLYLIEQGADIHVTRSDGISVLWFMANRGNTEVAEELLRRGAILDYWSAVMLGKVEEVKAALVENPTLLETTDIRDWTPLFNAVRQQQWNMVEFLLRAGANPNHHSGQSISLIEAVLHNQLKIVQLLVYAGANIHLQIPQGALLGFRMTDYGYNGPYITTTSVTLFGLAKKEGFDEIVEFLKLAGAI
ncbi:ankyrin repeat domain-containing protein [Armatimonas sp.]|uniref:ankyrin repeat domain-containing protein n=1 Tax=Armatimonas sp. TaxID=1872638 RepID=UPI00286B2E57|nr:ankyrin repeat domain-containing protein [Armatimonas sp.]